MWKVIVGLVGAVGTLVGVVGGSAYVENRGKLKECKILINEALRSGLIDEETAAALTEKAEHEPNPAAIRQDIRLFSRK